MSGVHTFLIAEIAVRNSRSGLIVLALLTCCSIAFFVLYYEKMGSTNAYILLAAAIACCAYGLTCYRQLREYNTVAVRCDEDGIWYLHVGKEHGLVEWPNIAFVRELNKSPYVELLSPSRQVVLTLNAKLENFEALRQRIQQEVNHEKQLEIPSTLSRQKHYHIHFIITLLSLFLCSLFLPLLLETNGTNVIFIVFLFYLSYEYLFTPFAVQVEHSKLAFTYPLHKRTLPFEEINAIELAPKSCTTDAAPGVWLTQHASNRVFKIVGLHEDSYFLKLALQRLVTRVNTNGG